MYRIEKQANKLKDSLDTYQITNILRSFSHCMDNRMWGDEKTFYNLESKILKNLDKINDRDVTHLMYAYGSRNVGNPELHQAFEKRLSKIADNLDYPSLFNALYYMMLRENPNKIIWEKMINATASNPNVLPLIYYKPFKMSELFIKHHFPQLDLKDYVDKFWYPERQWQILHMED